MALYGVQLPELLNKKASVCHVLLHVYMRWQDSEFQSLVLIVDKVTIVTSYSDKV